MPRGVYCNSDAVLTVHIDSSVWSEPDDPDAADYWKACVDGTMLCIETRWPSFVKCDRWAGREEHVMLENDHAEIVVYEYCGMTSISLVPSNEHQPEIAEHWCNQIAPGLQEMIDRLFPNHTYNRTSEYTMSKRKVVTP